LNEIIINFFSSVLWKTGVKTDSELTGDISLNRVSIDVNGRLVVELETRAHFRGLFVPKHHSLAPSETKDPISKFIPPMGVQTNFTFELMWSEETYDSPIQVKI
jgi:hypothetical protein